MKKVNKIHQIVRLRQFVQKWHAKAEARQERSGGTIGCSLSPRFKHRSPFVYDSDDEACNRMRPASPPPDVPKGCLAVYVGRERRRFIIPMSYLSRPAFRTLLDKAEEEFGFDHKGGLTIPCEVTVFRHVLRVLEGNDPAGQNLSLDELLKFYSAERDCGSRALNSTIAFESFPVAAAAVQYNFGLRKLL